MQADHISTGISILINANSNLPAIGVTRTSSASANFSNSENFTASPPVAAGATLATASATEGGGTTKTNPYRTVTNGIPATQSPTFDLNGNMTSDGTNTYQWDAENRLIQINPGSGNNTQFTYGGLSHVVEIVETVSGTLTSTKQFVWCIDRMCEARNASGTVTAQYFSRGQNTSGTNYFYTKDQLASIREMTDSSGNIQAQYVYDPFGLGAKLKGSLSADFQYAGYYNHSVSGLDFAVMRNYRPNLGRWLSRDPIGESGGANLYDYVGNCPITRRDPSGLDFKLDCADKPTDCPQPGSNYEGRAYTVS
jgi:RHS repeat-associated protein